MLFKKPFLKQYININLNKNILQSTSKSYVKEFLKKEKSINSDIIEIHNRPESLVYMIKNKVKSENVHM